MSEPRQLTRDEVDRIKERHEKSLIAGPHASYFLPYPDLGRLCADWLRMDSEIQELRSILGDTPKKRWKKIVTAEEPKP